MLGFLRFSSSGSSRSLSLCSVFPSWSEPWRKNRKKYLHTLTISFTLAWARDADGSCPFRARPDSTVNMVAVGSPAEIKNWGQQSVWILFCRITRGTGPDNGLICISHILMHTSQKRCRVRLFSGIFRGSGALFSLPSASPGLSWSRRAAVQLSSFCSSILWRAALGNELWGPRGCSGRYVELSESSMFLPLGDPYQPCKVFFTYHVSV